MEVYIPLCFLLLTVLAARPGSSLRQEEKKEGDRLPKPEGWRAQRQQSVSGPNPRISGANPSYDLSEAYNSMAASRMGGQYGNTGSRSSNSNTDFSKAGAYGANGASSTYYGSYSPSGYGGYASESGYGYSLTKYVDCSSALGLLSFILFIDVLRDVVEQLTSPNARRRREASPSGEGSSLPQEEEHRLLQYVADGGVEALVEDLPEVVSPLLQAHAPGGPTPPRNASCVQLSLCEVNAALSERHGGMGRVVGALFSNVVATAWLGRDSPSYKLALGASRGGRLGASCLLDFPCGAT